MPSGNPAIPENEFIRLFQEVGAAEAARRIGVTPRAVHQRRVSIEKLRGIRLINPNKTGAAYTRIEHPGCLEVTIKNGVILVGSDFHYWPGEPSLMHRAFVRFCKNLKPLVVIANGDVIDACSISRFPPIGWERRPTVQEEVEVAQDRLHEIEKAAGKARKIWTLGNHDARFETRLATVAPEFARVAGVHLKDHFPLWECCWRVDVNTVDDFRYPRPELVIKHRGAGGKHATSSNVANAGTSIITSHLHAAQVRAKTDFGTKWAVDTGCIADPGHRAFVDYTEAGIKDWRDAFCVATFRDGKLLPPELVLRWSDNEVVFRGEVIAV